MTAIQAAAMRVRTMADGSLRIEVEVEPNDAQSAFAMFGRPGARMAIAALKDGYGAKSDKPESEKLGPLALSAVQVCKNPVFQKWAGKYSGWEDPADCIKQMCKIGSRRELDTNPEAARLFRNLMAEFNAVTRERV
jgi:hypothetical protein